MKKLAIRQHSLTSVALLLLASSAHAALPGGLSGTWYNPAQSGHGVSLEVVAGDRAVALWHVYDSEGKPLTLYVDGRIDGRHIDGVAYAPTGMRFGAFDPATLQLPVWGEVDIDVASCSQATLTFVAQDPALGAGQIELTRLTRAAGLDCGLTPTFDRMPTGLYNGETIPVRHAAQQLRGIVDRDGRLWGYAGPFADAGVAPQVPGPGWVGAYLPKVIEIEPLALDGQRIPVRAALRFAGALAGRSVPAVVESGSGNWTTAGSGQFTPPTGSYDNDPQSWRAGSTPGINLVTGVNLTVLAGQYNVPLRTQFFDLTANLAVAADGSACLQLGDSCTHRGRLTTAEGTHGLIDFSLSDQLNPALAGYHGRGWLQDTPQGRQLVLIGDNGTQGLLLIGLRQ